MSAFKVVRDATNRVRGCGPNTADYNPTVPAGGRLDFSDIYLPIDPTPEELAAQQCRAALDADAAADVFIQRLRDATPDQIKTFVQNNVTDLTSARLFIGKLACAVALIWK